MEDQREPPRGIAWREVCPWLLLFRTFGIAIRLPLLCMATLACVLISLGWQTSAMLFVNQQQTENSAFQSVVERHGRLPGDSQVSRIPSGWQEAVSKSLSYGPTAADNAAATLRALFQSPPQATRLAYFLFGGLWTLLVCGLFGGAITRITAVQLGRHERISVFSSLRFACGRLLSYLSAPLLPLCGVGCILLLTVLQGYAMSLGSIGALIGGLLWIFTIIGAALSAVLLLGLLFGWPLMFVAISAEEGGDTFEALSRSYAYSFQRPLHYLFYIVLAVGLGGLGWLLVDAFCESVVQLAYWGASWGAGEKIQALRQTAEQGGGEGAFGVGAKAIGVCVWLVRGVADSFHFSFLWCAATAIYLLLRRDVDEAEFDEVYLENDEHRYGLPPMENDERGVPRVASEDEDTAN